MIGDSLTIENLESILEAMDKIKEIDRSLYFKQYSTELSQRLSHKYDELDFNEQKQLQEIEQRVFDKS